MKNLARVAIVAALSSIVTPASAITLNPGSAVLPTGVTLDASVADPVMRPELGGTVQNDNLVNFSHDPTPITPFSNVGGVVQNRVIKNSDDNMVFMQRVRDVYNIDGGTFAILGYTLTGYAGFSVDADFRLDGLGDKGFTAVSRSVDGDILGFRYESPIVADSINPPGLREESYFPALITDAKAYDTSGTMTIFGEIIPLGSRVSSGNASNVFSIELSGIVAPKLSTVPVPAAGFLLIGGIGLLGGVSRCKNRLS